MSLTAEERLRLLQRADAIWGALWAAFDALTEEQIDRPNTVGSWCGRDVIVHIANWEERAAEVIRTVERGEQPGRTYTTDAELDAWNEAHTAPLRAVSLAEARVYILRCHVELMGLVLTSPAVRPEWVLGNYPGHLDDLLALAGS